MKHLVLAAVVVAAGTVVTRAQPAPITGRVVADHSGEPVANARVLLDRPDATDRVVVLSDREGRFALPAPPGRHTLVASKTRFARSQVTTSAAEPVEIRLRLGAVVSGRIVDEAGDPVVVARVTVEPHGDGTATVGFADTDDRGEYRIGGLPAGTFTIAVTTTTPRLAQAFGGRIVGMMNGEAKTFYPNAISADGAESLRLDWGAERSGIDMVVPFSRAGVPPFGARIGPSTSQMVVALGQSPKPEDPAAAPSAALRGRVASSSGVPLPYALVTLAGVENPMSFSTRAAADGRFDFRDVPAGTHRVSASKAGYFSGDTIVDLKASARLEDVAVTLDPWGSLWGRVFDERGDPVQGARIELLQIRYEGGRRRLTPALAIPRTTDDLGSYRVFGLQPGQYIVSAEVSAAAAADLPGYARTFYPGTSATGEAQFVTIGPVPDVNGIDFSLARARTARVTGRYVDGDGAPTGGSLMLMPSQHSRSVVNVPVAARIQASGAFEFPNVPPGEYVIQGYRGRLNGWTEGEFGAVRVTVAESDVDGVVVRTSLGSSIHGRVEFEQALGSQPPPLSALQITPIPVDPDLSPPNDYATANLFSDGSFVIAGINGPRRLEILGLPAGWMLKEMRVGGVDVADRTLSFGRAAESLTGVEIVLTDRVSTLVGSVRDSRGRATANATVIAFTADRSFWYSPSRYLRSARTAADGTFSIAGLPFGNYYAIAVTNLPPDGQDAWQEPAYLESLIPRASSILLGDGQRVSVNPPLMTQ